MAIVCHCGDELARSVRHSKYEVVSDYGVRLLKAHQNKIIKMLIFSELISVYRVNINQSYHVCSIGNLV